MEKGETDRPESEANPSANIPALKKIMAELEELEKKKRHERLLAGLQKVKAVNKEEERKAQINALHFNTPILRTLRMIRMPSPQIHEVIIAFFLLLGEFEGYTRVCARELI